MSTETQEYTSRLVQLQNKWWKQLLPVQLPYKWHLRSLDLGFVLDIGCGIGRNLTHLQGKGVGIDHNPESVAMARAQGLEVYTGEQWLKSKYKNQAAFDSLLLSHILEHMDFESAVALVKEYLPNLKSGGRVLILCPQEAGYASDATHVFYFDQEKLRQVLEACSLRKESGYSFPFPAWVGRFFKYNEHVVVAQKR